MTCYLFHAANAPCYHQRYFGSMPSSTLILSTTTSLTPSTSRLTGHWCVGRRHTLLNRIGSTFAFSSPRARVLRLPSVCPYSGS